MTPQIPERPATGGDAANYIFLMNVARLVDADSYEVVPGYKLRRATVEEVTSIKNVLKSSKPDIQFGPSPWESESPDAGEDVRTLLAPDWRYFVVAFRGLGSAFLELQHAFDLAPCELEVGFTFLHMRGGQGHLSHSARLFHVLEDAFHGPSVFVDVSASDIEEVRTIHSQLGQHDRRLLDVGVLAEQLGDLKGVPHSSPLRFLGYFAILESLLTHAPKPSDPYDSITRQVEKKLALLDRRFPRRIDYGPFGGAAPETVWKKMYGYRSQLAHGGNPQFTDEFQTLVSHDKALVLIKETVKAVIRQALVEPQLLIDLREC